MNLWLPSSMRYGQFRYYWLALLAGVTGYQMLLSFTIGWLMFELTGEARHLAFLGIAIAIPALVLNLVGGVLADRMDPKVLVAAAQSISATIVVLLAILVLTNRVEVWHVLVAAFIIGATQAFDQPGRYSIYPRLVDREHIANAVAMESIVWNTVRVVAPPLAGIIIDRLSIHASMFFSAATFYVLAAVVSMLNLRPRLPARGQVLQQVGESFRYVGSHPIFLYVMLLTFCNSMFGMAYILLMPVFAKEVLHVGAEKVGLLLGVSGVGAILGTAIVGNLRVGHAKGLVMVGGGMLYGLAQILFSLAAWQEMYAVSMALLFVVGVANSLYLVAGFSSLQQLVPDQLRGRVMGLYGITWSLVPLGMAQAGFVAQYFGAPVAVAAGAAVIVVVAGLIYCLSPEIRSLRVAVPESQPAIRVEAGDAD